MNAFRNNLDSHNRTMNVVSPAVFNSLVVPLTGTGVANLTKDQGGKYTPRKPKGLFNNDANGGGGKGGREGSQVKSKKMVSPT